MVQREGRTNSREARDPIFSAPMSVRVFEYQLLSTRTGYSQYSYSKIENRKSEV